MEVEQWDWATGRLLRCCLLVPVGRAVVPPGTGRLGEDRGVRRTPPGSLGAWEWDSGRIGLAAWPPGRVGALVGLGLGAVAEDEKKFRYGSTHLPTHFSDTAIVRNEVN